MEAKFYLKDDTYVDVHGKTMTEPNLLFFSLHTPHPGRYGLFPTEFDNRATAEHVKNYSSAFNAFKAANPKYVLPWEGKEHLHKDGPHTAGLTAFGSAKDKKESK